MKTLSQPALKRGDVLDGKYVLRDCLGHGGMGSVFLAEQPALCRKVAIKVLYPELARSPEHAARMRDEAIAACHVRSPHCLNVIDCSVLPDGSHFWRTADCRIGPLRRRRGPLRDADWRDAVRRRHGQRDHGPARVRCRRSAVAAAARSEHPGPARSRGDASAREAARGALPRRRNLCAGCAGGVGHPAAVAGHRATKSPSASRVADEQLQRAASQTAHGARIR